MTGTYASVGSTATEIADMLQGAQDPSFRKEQGQRIWGRDLFGTGLGSLTECSLEWTNWDQQAAKHACEEWFKTDNQPAMC